MGQLASCATVDHCCTSAEKGTEAFPIVEPSAVLRVANLPPEVRLIAFIRRRSGADCDFGEIFEELFGSRDPVGLSKFASVLKERGGGATIDCQAAFTVIDRNGRGTVSAQDFENWQEDLEKKEVDGLRAWRDWLRKRFTTPSAAFHAMGKGEGDVLIEVEFTQSLASLGFLNSDPMELFRFIDKDFSGEITFAEFKSAMRSVGAERVKEKALRKAGDRSQNASRDASKANSPRGAENSSGLQRQDSKETKPRANTKDDLDPLLGAAKKPPAKTRRPSVSVPAEPADASGGESEGGN